MLVLCLGANLGEFWDEDRCVEDEGKASVAVNGVLEVHNGGRRRGDAVVSSMPARKKTSSSPRSFNRETVVGLVLAVDWAGPGLCVGLPR
jgi:hypothetical protein